MLGLYRLLYLINWVCRYMCVIAWAATAIIISLFMFDVLSLLNRYEPHYHPEYIVWAAGVIQSAIYLDFFGVYLEVCERF